MGMYIFAQPVEFSPPLAMPATGLDESNGELTSHVDLTLKKRKRANEFDEIPQRFVVISVACHWWFR